MKTQLCLDHVVLRGDREFIAWKSKLFMVTFVISGSYVILVDDEFFPSFMVIQVMDVILLNAKIGVSNAKKMYESQRNNSFSPL